MKRKGVKLIMSEYADIVIGNLSLHWFRNYLDSKIVSAIMWLSDIKDYIDALLKYGDFDFGCCYAGNYY